MLLMLKIFTVGMFIAYVLAVFTGEPAWLDAALFVLAYLSACLWAHVRDKQQEPELAPFTPPRPMPPVNFHLSSEE